MLKGTRSVDLVDMPSSVVGEFPNISSSGNASAAQQQSEQQGPLGVIRQLEEKESWLRHGAYKKSKEATPESFLAFIDGLNELTGQQVQEGHWEAARVIAARAELLARNNFAASNLVASPPRVRTAGQQQAANPKGTPLRVRGGTTAADSNNATTSKAVRAASLQRSKLAALSVVKLHGTDEDWCVLVAHVPLTREAFESLEQQRSALHCQALQNIAYVCKALSEYEDARQAMLEYMTLISEVKPQTLLNLLSIVTCIPARGEELLALSAETMGVLQGDFAMLRHPSLSHILVNGSYVERKEYERHRSFVATMMCTCVLHELSQLERQVTHANTFLAMHPAQRVLLVNYIVLRHHHSFQFAVAELPQGNATLEQVVAAVETFSSWLASSPYGSAAEQSMNDPQSRWKHQVRRAKQFDLLYGVRNPVEGGATVSMHDVTAPVGALEATHPSILRDGQGTAVDRRGGLRKGAKRKGEGRATAAPPSQQQALPRERCPALSTILRRGGGHHFGPSIVLAAARLEYQWDAEQAAYRTLMSYHPTGPEPAASTGAPTPTPQPRQEEDTPAVGGEGELIDSSAIEPVDPQGDSSLLDVSEYEQIQQPQQQHRSHQHATTSSTSRSGIVLCPPRVRDPSQSHRHPQQQSPETQLSPLPRQTRPSEEPKSASPHEPSPVQLRWKSGVLSGKYTMPPPPVITKSSSSSRSSTGSSSGGTAFTTVSGSSVGAPPEEPERITPPPPPAAVAATGSQQSSHKEEDSPEPEPEPAVVSVAREAANIIQSPPREEHTREYMYGQEPPQTTVTCTSSEERAPSKQTTDTATMTSPMAERTALAPPEQQCTTTGVVEAPIGFGSRSASASSTGLSFAALRATSPSAHLKEHSAHDVGPRRPRGARKAAVTEAPAPRPKLR